jgi:predicted secreted Zn-dependent protease
VSAVAAVMLLAQAASVAALDAAPGVSIDWYDVAGSDATAIRAAIDRVRPRDENDGAPVDALTRFAIRWRWPRGDCAREEATLHIAARVTLPRLVGPVPDDVRVRWDRYLDALATHEARHVALVLARRDELAAALRTPTCAAANAAGKAVLAWMEAENVAYDAATDHGRREGVGFP